MPICRAARISASSRSPAPAGNTYRWSVLEVQPVRASQARLAAAAALISSGVSRAQIGYSVCSHSNRVPSVAYPRVIHWYRCEWVLTSPGVTSRPEPSTRVARAYSGGTGPGPAATIRPRSMTTCPEGYSLPAGSTVAT